MALLPTPDAGFDQPFEMLAACHGRVRRSLDLLARLVPHVAAHGADGDARSAAHDVLRYFDLAAPQHHEDEERHVFPALLAADAGRWGPLVDRLRQDHRHMATSWAALKPALQSVAGGSPSPALAAAAREFAALYDAHLAAEDGEAFPAAAAAADAAARELMGREMAGRRGAPWPPALGLPPRATT